MRWAKYAMVLGGCLAASAYAADPGQPDNENIAPPAAHARHHEEADANARTEEIDRLAAPSLHRAEGESETGAFLGVSTSPAAPVLRRQLGLSQGMGLVVEFVAPKSPASEAGIKQYDVLEKLNDQLLVNTDQLAALVRSFKPGDEVKVTLFRDGKLQTLTARLVEHELEPLERLAFPDPDMPRQQWLRGLSGREKAPPAHLEDSTVTWMDGNRSYTVTHRDGQRTLTVKDQGGQTILKAPIDTDQQRKQLPADVKEKLDQMIKSGLMRPIEPKPSNTQFDSKALDQDRL